MLPCGKGKDYIVRVEGFDDITLTTSEDQELAGELGVTAVKIDDVLYEAVNVVKATG